MVGDPDDEELVMPHIANPAPLRLVINRREPLPCMHKAKRVLHVRSRKVFCECGQQLEPFDVLRDLALRTEKIQWLHDDATKTSARLEELKRLERNARARLRRHGVDVPDKWELDRTRSGFLPMRINEDCIIIRCQDELALTADQADENADRLKRLAWEMRKENGG